MNAIDRRTFLKFAGLAGASGAAELARMPGFLPAAFAQQQAQTAGGIIAGKNPGMIVHNAKLGVMETPLGLLRQHATTPKEILYNRLHFPLEGVNKWQATIAAPTPESVSAWVIRVSGLVQRPKDVKLGDLMQMQHVKRTSVMQCAGNGRSYYWAEAKTPGSGWQHGGMGNLEWEGVPLMPLLQSLDLNPNEAVRFLTANGLDVPVVPGGADLIKSYHLTAPQLRDAILAVRMNGEPIPIVHGGPVRLIIPGFYGNMNVKWVTDLMLMPEETPSALMQKTYRMPHQVVEPGKFTAQDLTQQNSTPTYGFAIMSVFFSPMSGESVKSGEVELTGVAWNDGVVPLEEVRISLDQGQSWQLTQIEKADSAYAWQHWRHRVRLPRGAHEARVRATDAWGRSQPVNGLSTWNPGGWNWHGVDVVKFQTT